MTIIQRAEEYNTDDLYFDLEPLFGRALHLKCEGLNLAGSIKLKPAREMVNAAERAGLLGPGSTIVESSSGNLGVALSMIAAGRGYRFLCVTDTRCNQTMLTQMRAMGAEVHVVTEPAGERGLVGARIDRVAELCLDHPDYVWLNQYGNSGNWGAHRQTTGPEIAKQYPDLDVLFVGAGTTGTLMGCARYFKEYHPDTTVVAVDAEGSALFGGVPRSRMIPGLGNAVRPPILDASFVDDVVVVGEDETVRMCHRLARGGLLFGGSTGTVVSGALSWLERDGAPELCSVAVSPDLGTHYLNTVYQPSWVEKVYGRAI